MKYSLLIISTLFCFALCFFSACHYDKIIQEPTTLPAEVSTTAPAIPVTTQIAQTTIESVTEQPTTVASTEPSTAQPTTQMPVKESTTAGVQETQTYYSGYLGTSSKGYDVTAVNGVVYVNGILIANKTYSLPKEYNPGDITPACKEAFNAMKQDASAEGLNIYISSGFRSYGTQAAIYQRYCANDTVENTDRYSARPGHSEHQTGLAIDLNTITNAFGKTSEGIWVAQNCWKYGFILRYPENKEAQTGYRYEPWHLRYVGVQLAEDIYNSGLCLEEYLGITSEYR